MNNEKLHSLKQEMSAHLTKIIIPFWQNLRDDEFGGYYGYLDYDLTLEKGAVKGCILNSRILWFFSTAYAELGEKSLLDSARHAFSFLKDCFWDTEHGGVYWSVGQDGTVQDETKHSYALAFALYGLSAYYGASGESEALTLAEELFTLIEEKCKTTQGYKEAFSRDFREVPNEFLSENNVIATRTMNTTLHILEAYTEFYRVSKNCACAKSIRDILALFSEKIYNPTLKRQEVFFDDNWDSLLDLHSYGHDIESSWLIERACEVLGDVDSYKHIFAITHELVEKVYDVAYSDHSLANECEDGKVDSKRIWWVQAESVVGFLNAYQKSNDSKYLIAAVEIWGYIKDFLLDKRDNSEWLWAVDENGAPIAGKPIVEEWKCPYHNGRMCLEIIARL